MLAATLPWVEEIAELLRSYGVVGVVDPLAASGWHALLWHAVGRFMTVAFDVYSQRSVAWFPLSVADARDGAVGAWNLGDHSGRGWALLLSWPPHTQNLGVDLLQQWPGDYLVYVGERDSGMMYEEISEVNDRVLVAGLDFLTTLNTSWEAVKSWQIPRWPGLWDDATLYRRKK